MFFLTMALIGAAPAPAPLDRTTWTLTQLGTQNVSSPSPTLQVSGTQVSGFAGCNQYQGTFRRAANRLSITKVSLTRRACAPALMRAENDFIRVLGKVDSYRRTGQTLVLYAGKQRLVFRAASTPAPTPTPGGSMTLPPALNPAALSGDWQVVSLRVGGPIPVPASAALKLEAQGDTLSVSGAIDCNQITAQATASGEQLTFTRYSTTRMLCGSMKGETGLGQLLRSPVRVSVQGDQMVWKSAAGELTLRRAAPASAPATLQPSDLQGQPFTLRSIGGALPKTERPMTLSFGAARLSGDDACNTFTAPFSVTPDGRLSVGSMASTFVMCPPNHPPLTFLLMDRPKVTLSGDTLTLESRGEKWVFERPAANKR